MEVKKHQAFRGHEITEEELRTIPIPQETNTYKPIAHMDLISQLQEELYKRNIVIQDKWYRADREGTKLVGRYDLMNGNDEMKMSIALRNSYDKSISISFISGSRIMVCCNGCFSGDMQYVHKHTGSVVQDLRLSIETTIQTIEQNFYKLSHDAERMKQVQFTQRATAELIGRMYCESDLCTASQLSLIKDNFLTPEHEEFKEFTAWSLYNNFTNAYKTSHSANYVNDHIALHRFMETEILK